ncbi:EAL domain-containing protein [Pseudanabaena sp. FACHB-2040]|uniref:EAL domain-containing response regulator n=1 Tax=Pseudanabaena sp. FACHB-2040 TaxID=2692859 RepID=UPI0016826B5B|nr:EAL domain-containing protein [Pseudanabaena sp. FACHB-2040]MBD2259705.1 EAL domain-containing protein [Pseudanabaena sp. FACHB-2040]
MNRLNSALYPAEGNPCPFQSPSSLHLLIVEDAPEDVELVVHVLKTADIQFTFDVADTLEGCRICLADHRYDAVLADYRLPSLQAPQVLDLLLQSYQDLPFILVTGSLGEEAAVDCIKAGMTDYVLKDRLFRLPTVLQRALAEWALRQQQKQALSRLEQNAWRESILNRIVKAMRETLLLDEVLQSTADQLQQALAVSQCLILRPHEQQMQVQYLSQRLAQGDDLPPALPDQLGLQPRPDPFHILLFAEAPLTLQILDDESPQWHKAFRAAGVRSLIGVPLVYQQRYLGAICLQQTDHQRQWSESEIMLVQAVADQCAIAIHQAELYQQAQIELEQRRRAEAQLRHDAFHDTLTGLPNRALFIDRLSHALQLSRRRTSEDRQRHPHDFAVLFLDLDDFKVVNDSLSHYAGDYLLSVMAQRLSTCLRTGDTLARLGGDEFSILLEDVDALTTVIDVIDEIQSVLKLPLLLENTEVFVSASIGVVLNNSHYTQPSELLRDAEIAMYRAKHAGPGRYQVFDTSMHLQVSRRLKLENSLRRAIERQELWVAYQPIVDLSRHQVVGFEALVRWNHPLHGQISPVEFIPIAEHTGLIIPLGLWVLEHACVQLQHWREQTAASNELTISINLSGKQFAQPDLIERIDEILRQTQLTGSALKLEVTESVLIENEEIAAQTLHQLRHRGIEVCIDDFGTGYSSLSYLHRFPVDVLKIDRSFVSSISARPENQEVVKAILSLGLNLGLTVVAEGVETPEELQFLQRQQCEQAQGYWFAPPLAAAQAEDMLHPAYAQHPTYQLEGASAPPHLTDHLA